MTNEMESSIQSDIKSVIETVLRMQNTANTSNEWRAFSCTYLLKTYLEHILEECHEQFLPYSLDALDDGESNTSTITTPPIQESTYEQLDQTCRQYISHVVHNSVHADTAIGCGIKDVIQVFFALYEQRTKQTVDKRERFCIMHDLMDTFRYIDFSSLSI